MSGTGRWFCSAALLGTAALVLAGAGAADNSTSVPFMGTTENLCNGEFVDVQGTMHIEDHSTSNANGMHIQFTMNLVGVKGVAVLPPTGARYVESETDTGQTNISSDFVPFEGDHIVTQILTRLGEDGTADDMRYYLRFHMTVNANGVPTASVDDERLECK